MILRAQPAHLPDASRDPRFLARWDELCAGQVPSGLRELGYQFDDDSFAIEGLCEREGVPLLRGLFQWFLQELSAPVAAIEDLSMIFEECISNVVRHSYLPQDEKWLRFVVKGADADLWIEIHDRGRLGRTSGLAERLASIPKTGRPPIRRGGMGLYLITRMMDHVEFLAGESEDSPNILRMHKQLESRSG